MCVRHSSKLIPNELAWIRSCLYHFYMKELRYRNTKKFAQDYTANKLLSQTLNPSYLIKSPYSEPLLCTASWVLCKYKILFAIMSYS